jgi:hypothetical protein
MQHSIPQGPKATYIVHVHVCKYAGNPLTSGETTIYRYTSNNYIAKLVMEVTLSPDERHEVVTNRPGSPHGELDGSPGPFIFL